MFWGRRGGRGRMWWRGGGEGWKGTQISYPKKYTAPIITLLLSYQELVYDTVKFLHEHQLRPQNNAPSPQKKSIPPPLSPSSRATTNTIPYPLKHAHKDPVHQPPTREIVSWTLQQKPYVSLLLYFSVNSPNLRELISILSVEQVADVCCPA